MKQNKIIASIDSISKDEGLALVNKSTLDEKIDKKKKHSFVLFNSTRFGSRCVCLCEEEKEGRVQMDTYNSLKTKTKTKKKKRRRRRRSL